MTFEMLRQDRFSRRSDIWLLLPTLETLASDCDTVTEFGVRNGCSTVAFLAGAKKEVRSYDIQESDFVRSMHTVTGVPCKWTFTCVDTLVLPKIDRTDLLFFDTWHTYSQLKSELRFAHCADKYLVFHDTVSQGKTSLDDPGAEGINRAIDEYLQSNPVWKTFLTFESCNGLRVLRRQTA